jgi:aryl-phospho-beta-D-glucosidase BglC (GH1 family)
MITSLLIFWLSVSLFAANPSEFWSQQRVGANWFNDKPTKEWLMAAKKAGIEFVRLSPEKWWTAHQDFLLGNADCFQGIPDEDMFGLDEVLHWADSLDMKIVLTMLSLPGHRWKQHNDDVLDHRLWLDSLYQPRAALYWKHIAEAFTGHPCLVGYNILNEPVPERSPRYAKRDFQTFDDWYQTVKGTTADLNRFYALVIKKIREVDMQTPIILDCGSWADPAAISYLEPVDDSLVLYSFHMYEPWDFVNRNNGGRYSYPEDFEPDTLRAIVAPVVKWQQEHDIPSNKIIVGEFGCFRQNQGADKWLADAISTFDQQGWHWAFYAFREDDWPGMDYELGAKPMGEAYWKALANGEEPKVKRSDNPIWRVISDRLKN